LPLSLRSIIYKLSKVERFSENYAALQKYLKDIIGHCTSHTIINKQIESLRLVKNVVDIYDPTSIEFSSRVLNEISLNNTYVQLFEIKANFDSHQYIASLADGIDFKKAIKRMMQAEHLKAEETVIYSYWANEFTVGLAQLHAENPAIKCYTRAHSGDLYFDRNTENYLPWRKFIMDKLNAVLAISKSGKEYYESTLNKKNNDSF
jgi:hypothetical protein